MPDQAAASVSIDTFAHRIEKQGNDLDMDRMRLDPSLQQYALGQGYTAISNPPR
jgi:hypothetical protein